MAFWGYTWNDLQAQLNRIEARLISLTLQEGRFEMATQATLDRLNADVAANTSATQAAALALAGFVKTVADLTAQLQAAIASDDEAAIKAAADALEANNTQLSAAVPTTAAAVAANTPAAGQ